MGVEGLWKLLDENNAGKDVTLESMENQIIAIDCSIWLNQFVKGIRDKFGNTKEDAHLIGTFNKICKLLTSKIKPVFVFDGGCPELKKNTIIRRQQLKKVNLDKNNKRIEDYLKNHLESVYSLNLQNKINLDLNNLQSNKFINFKNDNLFELGITEDFSQDSDIIEEENVKNLIEDCVKKAKIPKKYSYDFINSKEFCLLPIEERYEILTEIKVNKIVKFEDLPEDSLDFSSYQMKKLIKQRSLQKKIEEIQKEMIKLPEELVSKYGDSKEIFSSKIASDETSSILFIKNKESEIKPIPIQKKTVEKKYYTNIYGDINEFDYGKTDELLSGKTSSLINKKFIKEEKSSLFQTNLKQDSEIILDDSDSTDDDFVTVDEIQENSIDNLSLSTINPLVYIYEMNAKQNVEIKKKYDDLNKKDVDSLSINNDKTTNIEKDFICEKLSFNQESIKELKIMEKEVILSNVNNNNTIASPYTLPNDKKKEVVTVESDTEDTKKNVNKEENYTIIIEQLSTFKKSNDSSVNEIEKQLSKKDNLSDLNSLKKNIEIDDEMNKHTNKESEKYELMQETDDLLNKKEPKKIKLVQLNNPPIQKPSSKIINPKNTPKEYSEETLIRRKIMDVKRQNASVEEMMIVEVKQLLDYFGIPYITAVMEAEAQCAALELFGLTNGTITEDSDVFLFGAKTVYRNFFNQNKFITKYTVDEIEHRIKLNRDHLICFAMLTGSDYTNGIKGIGSITAYEILSEFKGEELEPLIKFKNWWTSRKSGKLVVNNKVRKKLEKYDLPKSFPSKIVFDAYKNPIVNKSKEKFIFGKPDYELIKEFAISKFNWSKEKTEGALAPIFKRLNERQTQTRIDYFFQQTKKIKDNPLESKRLKEARNKFFKNIDSKKSSTITLNDVENKTNLKNKVVDTKELTQKTNLKEKKKIVKDKKLSTFTKTIKKEAKFDLDTEKSKNTLIKDYFQNKKTIIQNLKEKKNSETYTATYLPLSQSSSSDEI